MRERALELVEDYLYQAFVAFLSGVAGVAGSYVAVGNTRGFVGAAAASVMIELTPGAVVTVILENLGSLGEVLAAFSAGMLVVGFLGALSMSGMVFGRYTGMNYVSAAIAFLLTSILTLVLTGSLASSFGAAAAAGFVVGIWDLRYEGAEPGRDVQPKPNQDRRRALKAGVGTLGFGGAAYIAGGYRTPEGELGYVDGGLSPPDEVQRMLDEAEEKEFDLAGAPGLVSEIGEFYNVDINTVTPRVHKETWSLEFTGAVSDGYTVDYRELTSMEPEHRFLSLRCVGDDVNGDLMDNAVWSGVPVADLLDEAGPSGSHVVMHGDDDFFNTVPMEVFRTGFLAWGMNGRLLPFQHGHPVRILLPGHWGEVNVKWLREAEVVDSDVEGYWESRGWDGTGRVNPVAKIWSSEVEDGRVTVGGHAYAGLAGVESVEVSVDGGDTWQEAELTERLGGERDDVWRQWRYSWDAERDSHQVVARMTDVDGVLQEEEVTGSSPDGATGWVSEEVSV